MVWIQVLVKLSSSLEEHSLLRGPGGPFLNPAVQPKERWCGKLAGCSFYTNAEHLGFWMRWDLVRGMEHGIVWKQNLEATATGFHQN